MSPLSATILRVNKQHYEVLIREPDAIGTYGDSDIHFREA
jgi:hypothetical protein